jgi:hypothetical protein
MAAVVHLPMTPAQRALARYREEERAFGVVLEALKHPSREDLFLKLFSVYRSRMVHLRRLCGGLLRDAELPSAADELKRFSRDRDP